MRDSQRYTPQAKKFSYEVTRLSKIHQEICAFYTNSAVFIAMRRAHGASDNQGNMAQRTDHHMLEEENDKMVDHLSSKVQALKSLTIDIGQEVKYQNKMLGEMDTDFDTGGSLLSSTMGRLTALTKKGHHKVMLYLILFCLFVFVVAWYIIKRR